MTEPEFSLTENAHAVWKELQSAESVEISELVSSTGVDQSQIVATANEGERLGYIELRERPRQELVPSEKAREILKVGHPERLAVARLVEAGGQLAIGQLISWAKQSSIPPNEIFKWGSARGWIERVKDESGVTVKLTDRGRSAVDAPDDDERALEAALERGSLFLDELAPDGVDSERVVQLLGKRTDVARIRNRRQRYLSLTPAGRSVLEAGVQVMRERNVLTPEDLDSGAWQEITLRPYDISLPSRDLYPAKIHPLRKIMEETRRAFLEMGFSEVVSPMVESAFWNFDALFQPQDHPARDMQDTFYMKTPHRVELPDDSTVEPVRRTHEDGWTTGSEGWGYRWDAERARQVVLRTHTTAATIRALSRNPDPPGKYFCVGWTYRNESISFKHLPVFHQVDGIVVDKEANLATLLGTLQEFYHKMGFGQVKFKPAFYPYTEPSVDVVVYMESRGKWIEMGGSGIFRPEVTLPLGCRYPVLAWGLGIERLAMLRLGISDIRELFRSNLDSLQEVPLCR